MDVKINDINIYLSEVKDAIKKGQYKIARNNNRKENEKLFLDYVVNETMIKNILLKLTAMDFSEILQNKHEKYKHEQLYVFGKDVKLLERFGNTEKTVSLYIKLNKIQNGFVFVISLHEQKYPIKYYFR